MWKFLIDNDKQKSLVMQTVHPLKYPLLPLSLSLVNLLEMILVNVHSVSLLPNKVKKINVSPMLIWKSCLFSFSMAQWLSYRPFTSAICRCLQRLLFCLRPAFQGHSHHSRRREALLRCYGTWVGHVAFNIFQHWLVVLKHFYLPNIWDGWLTDMFGIEYNHQQDNKLLAWVVFKWYGHRFTATRRDLCASLTSGPLFVLQGGLNKVARCLNCCNVW